MEELKLAEIARIRVDASDCEFAGLGNEIIICCEQKSEEPDTSLAVQTELDKAGIAAFVALADGTYQVIETKSEPEQ